MSEPISILVPITECGDVEVCLIYALFNATNDQYFAGLSKAGKLRALKYVYDMLQSRLEEPTNDQAS